MKYGPISAATSAMIKAIANPSSVVCTVSPFEHARSVSRGTARPIRRTARKLPRRNQRRSSAIYRDNCGEVTARSRGNRSPSPAGGQPFEAAQHEGRPPFRIFGVVEPQFRQPTQQGRDRDLGLDARQLGAEAKVDTPAKGQRADSGAGDIEAVR